MKLIVITAVYVRFYSTLFPDSVAVIHHSCIVEHGIHLYVSGVCRLSLGFFSTVELVRLNRTFFVY
jgi:hypothetical protein